MTTRVFIIRVMLAYGVGALAWVYFSDLLIQRFGGPAELAAFSTFKGFGFVVITVALLAIALRRMAAIARADDSDVQDREGSVWPTLLMLLAIAVAVLIVSAMVYRSSAQALLKERQASLVAMTKLQAQTLGRHRSQRADAARALAASPLLRDAVDAGLLAPDDQRLARLRTLLHDTAAAVGFSAIELWNASGQRLLREGSEEDVRADVRAAIPEVLRSGEVSFIPRAPGIDRYGYLVPVAGGTTGSREVIALLYLDMEAEAFLYPFLTQSSAAQGSMEELLVRRNGAGAWTFASPTHGPAGPAMGTALPAGLAQLAEAAQAVEKGDRGVAHMVPTAQAADTTVMADPTDAPVPVAVTTDQHGREVLAVARIVPNSFSTLITKIDTTEVLSEARGLTLFSAMSTAAALAVTLTFGLLLSERHKLRSALREMEQAKQLAAAEERFELAVRGTDEGVWDLNLKSGDSYFSPRWKELLGFAPDALLDALDIWNARIHPEDRERVRARWQSVVKGEARVFEAEFRLKRDNGAYRDFSSRGYAVTDAGGQVVRIVGLTADISERKQTERRLRLAATVFTGTDEGIVVTDPKKVITAVNPAFTAITGYEEAEVTGRPVGMLQSGRQDREFYRQMWKSLRTTGTWRGELWNRRKNGEVYLQQLIISAVSNAAGEVQSYVGAFHDITQARRSQFELDHLTHYDALTDLPNRTLLLSLMEHVVGRASLGCALLFVDLDHFKTVNDSLGLLVGDSVLQAAARRIRAVIPADATLARYGADEFVALIEGGRGADDAASVAARIIAALKDPFIGEGGQEIYVGASIGISLHPDDAGSAQLLLQHAHSALFQAKASGRGTYSFYTGAMTRAAKARIEMEADLRRALSKGEFLLNYQPIIALDDLTLNGAEALVRWMSPTQGLVMPDRFVPLAEETGLIVPLGTFVLEEACRQLVEWNAAGISCPFVSVNLSPRQFNEPDLCRRVADILGSTGLPPEQLELEITERILFEEQAKAEHKLAELAEMGVKVAVDDFGTGYSSLSYLKRFPIRTLKIDKSFVRDLPHSSVDGEIVRAVIAVGRALSIEVLAEGVETEAQMDFLRTNGCLFGQGYLWSHPLPAQHFRAFAHAAQAARPGRHAEDPPIQP